MAKPSWIVDGWGSFELLADRFRLADRILFFDYPLEVHLASARKREEESARGACAYEPPGCRYADIPDLMESTLRRVDAELLPQIREMLSPYPQKVGVLRDFSDIPEAVNGLTAGRVF
jgi:hypothetical protein